MKQGRNRGSTTVEMCFVMPIILGILVMVIYLMFDAVNDSIVRGNCYTAIYTYRGDKGKDLAGALTEGIGGALIGTDEGLLVTAGAGKGSVKACVHSEGDDGGYVYRVDAMEFETEYDKTTDRLRRWQFYGNVLWE